MQFKLTTLITVALSFATYAVAAPVPDGDCPDPIHPTTPSPPSQAPPSGAQCCSTVKPASDFTVTPILASIGVVLSDLNVNVGLDCSPITVGSAPCSSNTVVCNDNSHGNLISIGCVPVTF